MDITRREALRRVMIGGAALATGMGQYVDLYGLERVQRFMPWKSMVDNGVPLSFGSDWSAAPVNPLRRPRRSIPCPGCSWPNTASPYG